MLLRLIGDLLSPPACSACDDPLSDGHRVFCRACSGSIDRGPRPRRGVVAFGAYGGALAVAIRRLKYEQRPDLSRPLGNLLRRAGREAELRADRVIPVPLHVSRLVARGYNQSALLGAHLAIELGAELATDLLVRTVPTPPQADLGRAERAANVAGAFAVPKPERVCGLVVALVDDVCTTGATLEACRQALLSAGALRVDGCVLATTLDTSAP